MKPMNRYDFAPGIIRLTPTEWEAVLLKCNRTRKETGEPLLTIEDLNCSSIVSNVLHEYIGLCIFQSIAKSKTR